MTFRAFQRFKSSFVVRFALNLLLILAFCSTLQISVAISQQDSLRELLFNEEMNTLQNIIEKNNIKIKTDLNKIKAKLSTSNPVKAANGLRAVSNGIKSNLNMLKSDDEMDRVIGSLNILEGISTAIPPPQGAVGVVVFGFISDILQIFSTNKPSQIQVFQKMMNEQTETLLKALKEQTHEIKNEITEYWGVEWGARIKGAVGLAQTHLYNKDYMGSDTPLSHDKLQMIQRELDSRTKLLVGFKSIIDFLWNKVKEKQAYIDNYNTIYNNFRRNKQRIQKIIYQGWGIILSEAEFRFRLEKINYLFVEMGIDSLNYEAVRFSRNIERSVYLHTIVSNEWRLFSKKMIEATNEKFDEVNKMGQVIVKLLDSYCLLSLLQHSIAHKVSVVLIAAYPDKNAGFFNVVHEQLVKDYQWFKQMKLTMDLEYSCSNWETCHISSNWMPLAHEFQTRVEFFEYGDIGDVWIPDFESHWISKEQSQYISICVKTVDVDRKKSSGQT